MFTRKKIVFLTVFVSAIVLFYCLKSFAHERYLANSNSGSISKFAYDNIGIASWYGKRFHGRKTANGERYDMFALTAAHRRLPLGTILRVTNLANNRHVIVKVNDRGPYIRGRIIDLSVAAATELRMVTKGVSKVKIEVLSLGS